MTEIKEYARDRLAGQASATRAFRLAIAYLSDVELDDLAANLLAQADQSDEVAERINVDHEDAEARESAHAFAEDIARSTRKLGLMAKHRDIVCGDLDAEPAYYGLFCARCAVPLDDLPEHCPTCNTGAYVFIVDADRNGFPRIVSRASPEEMDAFVQDLRDGMRSGLIDPDAPIGDLFQPRAPNGDPDR